MRVLQVNKFLYPKGGAEIVCLGLVEQLRAAGHEVRLFGMRDPRNPPGPDDDCYPHAVDYHARRGPLRKAAEALRTIYGLRARRGMASLLDRWRPDVIHAHNIYHQLTPSILAPARARRVPVLLTLHDYKLACPVYTFLREGQVCEECLGRLPMPLLRHRCKGGSAAESGVLFAEALVHRALRSYERGVSLFTAPSRFLADKIAAGGVAPERIVHLPNALPLDAGTLECPYAPPPVRDAPELLWVGRLSYEKGLATLLAAVARARRPLRLVIVGDGPEEESLRRLAGELDLGGKARFLGRRPRAEIPGLLAAADAAILPSEWYENAPLSVLESLALGRPVLASRLGGTPELVEDGETGWLFEPRDADALAACLDDWAAAPGERRRRGERAHAESRRRFHPDRILERTLALYARLGARS